MRPIMIDMLVQLERFFWSSVQLQEHKNMLIRAMSMGSVLVVDNSVWRSAVMTFHNAGFRADYLVADFAYSVEISL